MMGLTHGYKMAVFKKKFYALMASIILEAVTGISHVLTYIFRTATVCISVLSKVRSCSML